MHCIAVTCVIIPTSVNGVTTIVSWLKFDTRTGIFHFDGSTRDLPTMRPVFSANNVKPSSRPLDGNARPPVVRTEQCSTASEYGGIEE